MQTNVTSSISLSPKDMVLSMSYTVAEEITQIAPSVLTACYLCHINFPVPLSLFHKICNLVTGPLTLWQYNSISATFQDNKVHSLIAPFTLKGHSCAFRDFYLIIVQCNNVNFQRKYYKIKICHEIAWETVRLHETLNETCRLNVANATTLFALC